MGSAWCVGYVPVTLLMTIDVVLYGSNPYFLIELLNNCPLGEIKSYLILFHFINPPPPIFFSFHSAFHVRFLFLVISSSLRADFQHFMKGCCFVLCELFSSSLLADFQQSHAISQPSLAVIVGHTSL